MSGRLLGVDYGEVRVGLAICDPDRIITSPLAIYERRDEVRDAEYFRKLVSEERVIGLVVGMPIHCDGKIGDKAQEAHEFGLWLGELTSLPVIFWDERFTTRIANHLLRQSKLSHRKRKARRDALAAQVLLQSYIEAGCPSESPLGPLDQ